MLCATCISIFSYNPGKERYPPSTIRGRHHASLANLKAAAQQGCYLCSGIVLDYDDGQPNVDSAISSATDDTSTFISFELGLYHFNSSTGRLGTLSFESNDGLLASASYDIVYTQGLQAPKAYGRFLETVNMDMCKEPWRVRDDGFASSCNAIPDSTSQPEVLSIAEEWLTQCMNTHSSCENSEYSSGNPWYPKRLLDLSSSTGQVRLVVTENEKPQERYATLSHCWGPNPICTLRADNLNDWIQKIPTSELSQTFTDAIAATRMLKIRYLWIDSLCIVQAGAGSKEDWAEHAVAMRLVYTNSLVNIAAARAECGADGLFATRTDLWMRPCHVQWPWPSNYHDLSPDAFWTIRKYEHHSYFAIRTLPLYTRGWVVQERFMAPRVLHFGKDRIFWECKEQSIVEESFPKGFKNSCPEYESIITWPFNLTDPSQSVHISGGETLPVAKSHWSTWQQMVNEYTRCDLSFPDKDEFIALAGVAEKFGQLYDHQYVAGLFRQHLPFDLLWQCKDERAETYRAPSWSWASIDGQTHFPVGGCPYCEDCCESFATVRDVSVQLVNDKFVYGPIRHAELTLTCYLFPCRIKPAKTAGTGLRQTSVFYPYLSPDATPPHGVVSNTDDPSVIWGEAYIDDEEDSLRGSALTASFTAWAVPLIELKSEPHNELHKHRGLLLKKDQDRNYLRLGTYVVKDLIMEKILSGKNLSQLNVTVI